MICAECVNKQKKTSDSMQGPVPPGGAQCLGLLSLSAGRLSRGKVFSVFVCDRGTEDETAKFRQARNRKALMLLWVYLEVIFKNKD